MSFKGMRNNTIHIFTDGSFHPTQGAGYGFVAVNANHEIVYTEAEPIYDTAYQSSTSAELIAALRATKWAERMGYRHINIHHDFVGVRTTALATPYHTNHLHVQYFEYFLTRMGQGGSRVYFHKVAAHTGNTFNTLADKLAKHGRQRNLRRAWLSLTKQYGALHPALSIFQAADRKLA